MRDELKPNKVNIDDLILKSRHVDPNYAELQDYMDNFHESIVKRMVEETDKYIMSQFARFGLSRDEVLSLTKQGTIWASQGACWTRYWLEDEPLFDIVLTDGVLEGCRYGRMYQCIDLKEVKEDETSGV